MGNLVLTIGRLFLLMFLTLGLGCYFWPESMIFIPQPWQEGFVIAIIPCCLALFTDISFSIIQAILKEKKKTMP